MLYEQVLKNLNPAQVWDDLHCLAGEAEPVLLCYEEIPSLFAGMEAIALPDAMFCHRRLVAEWLQAELGVEVLEKI